MKVLKLAICFSALLCACSNGAKTTAQTVGNPPMIGDLKAINVAGNAETVAYDINLNTDNENNSSNDDLCMILRFNRDGICLTAENDEFFRVLDAKDVFIAFSINIKGNRTEGYQYQVPRSPFVMDLEATEFNNKNLPVKFKEKIYGGTMQARYSNEDINGNWTKMELNYIGSAPSNSYYPKGITITRKIKYFEPANSGKSNSYVANSGKLDYYEIKDDEINSLLSKAILYDTSVMTPEFAAVTQRFVDNPGTTDSMWKWGLKNSGSGNHPTMLTEGEEDHVIVFDDEYLSKRFGDGGDILFLGSAYSIDYDGGRKYRSKDYAAAVLVWTDKGWKVDNVGKGDFLTGIIFISESFRDLMTDHLNKVEEEIRSGKLEREIKNNTIFKEWIDRSVLLNSVEKYRSRYME